MTGHDTTIAGFPRFIVAEKDEQLGFLSFGGHMFGGTEQTTGRYLDSNLDKHFEITLILWNKTDCCVFQLKGYDSIVEVNIFQFFKVGTNETSTLH